MNKLFPPSASSFRKLSRSGVLLLGLAYLAANLFHLGGDEFVFTLNNNILLPFALGAAVCAFVLWRQIPGGNQNRSLWAGLALGWALWAIAEFWWGIAALIGQEVPYPSGADFLWLIGYLPMYFALAVRIRSLPASVGRLQRAGLVCSALGSIGWTVFFILKPILAGNDAPHLWESVLNILFPLADLVLLLLVFRIFFSYQHGRYGRAWVWLSIGFLLHSISNLIFSYATTVDLYYPGGQANLASIWGVDLPYNFSYVFWLVGLLLLWNLQKTYVPFAGKEKIALALVPDTHLLVFIAADQMIDHVSQNFGRVFPLVGVNKTSLSQALGLSAEEADSVIAEVKAQRVCRERSVTVTTLKRRCEARLSGVAILNPDGGYEGASFVLRLWTQDASVDHALTPYQRGLVASLLNRSGVDEQGETRRLLAGYYLAYIQALYNRILAEGGMVMADALVTALQATARASGWEVSFHAENLLDVHTPSLAELQRAFPLLQHTTEQFVSKVIDEPTVTALVRQVQASIDPAIHAGMERYRRA